MLGPADGSFSQVNLEKIRQIDLKGDSVYYIMGLSLRAGSTFKTGAVLVGADAVYRVEDDSDKLHKVVATSEL